MELGCGRSLVGRPPEGPRLSPFASWLRCTGTGRGRVPDSVQVNILLLRQRKRWACPAMHSSIQTISLNGPALIRRLKSACADLDGTRMPAERNRGKPAASRATCPATPEPNSAERGKRAPTNSSSTQASSTSCVCITTPHSLPASEVMRVCQTIVVRPRCRAVHSPVTTLPTGARADELGARLDGGGALAGRQVDEGARRRRACRRRPSARRRAGCRRWCRGRAARASSATMRSGAASVISRPIRPGKSGASSVLQRGDVEGVGHRRASVAGIGDSPIKPHSRSG